METKIVYATKRTSIAIKHQYPTLVGKRQQVFSRADATGIRQQFIDRGMQKELGLSCKHTAPPAGQTGYLYEWTLVFYIHPGMRREVKIEPKLLPDIVDYIHALAIGVAPFPQLEQRLDDWVKFHTFGFGGYFATGKEILKYLQDRHLPFAHVEKNIVEYGIEAHAPAAKEKD